MGNSTRAARLRNLALSESGFLFDPATGHTYSLNATGAFLLRALIEGKPLEELATAVEGAFEIDQETASRDAEQFLLHLGEMGLWATDEEGA